MTMALQHSLSVAAEGNHLAIYADGKQSTMDLSILPASLWDSAILRQQVLLNTLDGSQMRVASQDLEQETVKVGARDVSARHYRLTGELERDLWFDARNALVHVQFKGTDGSSIVYELK